MERKHFISAFINKVRGVTSPPEPQGAYRIEPWPTLEQIRQRTVELGDPRVRLREIRKKIPYADAKTLRERLGPR